MVSRTPIAEAKADLRADSLARREALSPDLRAQAAEAVAARPLPVGVGAGLTVSGYGAIGSEINPAPLMRRCAEAGARLALPAVAGRGKPLLFRRWNFGEPLGRGQWGIGEPKADAPEVSPDILIVPLLAFDRRGHRLGYGAGYYDMTLNALRARKTVVAIGLAYAAQEVESVPATVRDARLDFVLTEREAIDCRGA